jgi:hypothetical protein
MASVSGSVTLTPHHFIFDVIPLQCAVFNRLASRRSLHGFERDGIECLH